MKRSLAERIGRRGAVLGVLGLMYVVYGLAIITATAHWPVELGSWWPVSVYAVFLVPMYVWGRIWFFAGLVLWTGMLLRRDGFHFALAIAMEAIWAMGAVFYDLWGIAAIHVGFALVVLIIAGWHEPVRTLQAVPDE